MTPVLSVMTVSVTPTMRDTMWLFIMLRREDAAIVEMRRHGTPKVFVRSMEKRPNRHGELFANILLKKMILFGCAGHAKQTIHALCVMNATIIRTMKGTMYNSFMPRKVAVVIAETPKHGIQKDFVPIMGLLGRITNISNIVLKIY